MVRITMLAGFLLILPAWASLRGAEKPSSPTTGVQAKPSSITGCPAGFVDCGTCLCTPKENCETGCTAQVPGAASVPNVPNVPSPEAPEEDMNQTNETNETNETNVEPHIVWTPSRLPYCPRTYVDCGTCLCVPMSTCTYCPGAWSPAPPTPGPPTSPAEPRPSQVPGCPANYYDCGTCQCVP
ncbi:unnamed protein product, partial [Durusdinium trenchii]